MAKWLITENSPADLDITRDGRAFRYGVEDKDEAIRLIRKSPRYSPKDIIRYEEPDGYRRPVR